MIQSTDCMYDKERKEKLEKSFKKEFGEKLPVPKTLNCINCGTCYNSKFEKLNYRIGWL